VVGMSDWFGADIDHANWTLARLLRYVGSLACVIYSTTRSTASERRLRLLMPLSRDTSVEEFSGVWRAINLLFDGELDQCTKNCNRLHYLPAAWIGGNNEYHCQGGDVLDVEQLLQVCPPEPPVYYAAVFQADGVRAPDGTEIITQAMIERQMSGLGGGRFIRLLCAAAARYKANGWLLTPSELTNAALSVSPRDSSGIARAVSAYREAERAIDYINQRVETLSPKDRVIANLKWRWQQQEV
jgi:hypothetical protein